MRHHTIAEATIGEVFSACSKVSENPVALLVSVLAGREDLSDSLRSFLVGEVQHKGESTELGDAHSALAS